MVLGGVEERMDVLCESIRARETRKVMNVRGAISNYSQVRLGYKIRTVGVQTLETALSFGDSGGNGFEAIVAKQLSAILAEIPMCS
jgi:hypothetical protein